MEFWFASRKLQRLLSNEKELRRCFQKKTADKIVSRMKVLKQARNLAEVRRDPPDRCHQLHEDRDEEFAVVLHDNWRLVFAPYHDPVPRKQDGGIDLERVTEIIFLHARDDYH